jgi:hypothetical protein
LEVCPTSVVFWFMMYGPSGEQSQRNGRKSSRVQVVQGSQGSFLPRVVLGTLVSSPNKVLAGAVVPHGSHGSYLFWAPVVTRPTDHRWPVTYLFPPKSDRFFDLFVGLVLVSGMKCYQSGMLSVGNVRGRWDYILGAVVVHRSQFALKNIKSGCKCLIYKNETGGFRLIY